MRLAVLGSGGVGGTLGVKWAQAGHSVVFGSRDPSAEKVQKLLADGGANSCADVSHEAIRGADAILLAVPWPAMQQTLATLGDLSGKLLIDCSNPLKSDFSGIEVPPAGSAAQQIAEWAPGAIVVKAFNTAGVKTMRDPMFGGQKATMFHCGDDPAAKLIVAQLVSTIGFEPLDAGSLSMASHLEQVAMFYIHLAFKQGLGSNSAIGILRR